MALETVRKLPSDQHVTVWLGPKGSVADPDKPTAVEINAMTMASPSISWNDFDFGLQASETTNDPSLADVSNYTDFGQANFGGSMSFYYPKEYDDNSNLHSVVYDLTDIPWTELDVVIRIDGAIKTSVPAADGDFVSVFSVMTDGEANSLQGADALRRTVSMLQQAAFAHRTVVGAHTLSVTPAAGTVKVGEAIALKVEVGTTVKRVYTNAVSYRSSDPTKALVSPNGVVKGVAAGEVTITVEDKGAGTTTTATITVTA